VNYNEIYPNLYVGSAPHEDEDLSNFDALVLTATEWQLPTTRFPVEVLRVPLVDGVWLHGRPLTPPMTDQEIRSAIAAAKQVASWLRQGKRVLVTCWMGLNRSSLVASLAVLMLHSDLPVNTVIENVRAARGDDALRNKYFLTLLKHYARRRY
jgi:protein-tyrosine phosphatase